MKLLYGLFIVFNNVKIFPVFISHKNISYNYPMFLINIIMHKYNVTKIRIRR